MALRWLGAAVVTATTILLAEAPVMLAGPALGLLPGILVVATVGALLAWTVVHIAPAVDPSTRVGSSLIRFRVWWEKQSASRATVIRWSFRFGPAIGFALSSVLAGPIVTSLAVSAIRGGRTRLSQIITSSVLFATVAVSFYSGLWAIVRR